VASRGEGAFTMMDRVMVHPLEPVTVAVYSPAGSPEGLKSLFEGVTAEVEVQETEIVPQSEEVTREREAVLSLLHRRLPQEKEGLEMEREAVMKELVTEKGALLTDRKVSSTVTV